MHNEAHAAKARGDYRSAVEVFRQAIDFKTISGITPTSIVISRNSLGELYLEQTTTKLPWRNSIKL